MILETILLLIMCHMIGDYVLQTRFIAESKGEFTYHLLVHCVLYTMPFYLCFGFTWHLAIIFISHMIIDPLKARWGKINYFQDQLMHYIVCGIYLI